MDKQAIDLLVQAEKELQALQVKSASRDRAVALTHLQTALLWLHKPVMDDVMARVTVVPNEQL